MTNTLRSLNFIDRPENRFWWYSLESNRYVPQVLSALSDEEWDIMDAWFIDSGEKFSNPGEITIPAISLISSFISGNGIERVVQCGHYVGYSTLLLGFLLRYMGKTNSLFSIDIDPLATAYTQKWIDQSGLADYVKLFTSDSANPEMVALAEEFHGGKPQFILIDSSHQYRHTIRELDLWFEALSKYGMIFLHDVSLYAQQYDSTNSGGVLRAIKEWASQNNASYILLNETVIDELPKNLVYKDGCGLGIIQKLNEVKSPKKWKIFSSLIDLLK